MKYPKILSLTMANGLGFLVFGCVLAGCQKTAVHKSGLLTAISKSHSEQSRFPASAQKSFSEFQDTKQIYIYCQLNDLDPKACYQRNLSSSLKEFAGLNRVPASDLEKFKKDHSFKSAKERTDLAVDHVFEDLAPSLNKLVEKRVQFCKSNASFYMERCLKQYLKKETFEALNAYQSRTSNMNGHEYLYLKKQIERRLIDKLDQALKTIEAQA